MWNRCSERKDSYVRFSSWRAQKSLTSCHALTWTNGGYKAPLQTEQCKAPLPNSAWALQAVSQLHAVSFICFFQIGFLFNRRKAFILMAPLGLSPGRRATPDSCGMGRDRTLWDRMGQDGTGWSGSSSACRWPRAPPGPSSPFCRSAKHKGAGGNLHFFLS